VGYLLITKKDLPIISVAVLVVSLVTVQSCEAASVRAVADISNFGAANQTTTKNLTNFVGPVQGLYKPLHYIYFDGTNSYAVINGSNNYNAKSFSVSFWIKVSGGINKLTQPVRMIKRVAKAPYGWTFTTGNATKIGNNKLRFFIWSTLGSIYGSKPFTLSKNWTNIVTSFNGTSAKIYEDQVLVGTFSLKGSYAAPPSPAPIRIASGLIPHTYWRGYLSDLQVYNRPLSQVDTISISKGEAISHGLIGRWKLDEGSGSTIHDSSGNKNDGIVYNAIWK
jgi:concanavalin A-like lectin/glucanase superfamily protein